MVFAHHTREKRNERAPETANNVGGESSSTSETLNSSPECKYDVFLSFAGKDSRLKFTDHLYDALTRGEINAFRDNEERVGSTSFSIFCDIDPSDVRHQRQNFGEALAKHEKKFRRDKDKVQKWRNALSETSSISGWDTRGQPEAELIKEIVENVSTYLRSKLPSYYDNLVGIKSRVRDMVTILEIGLDDKLCVGIWGMGGVGKQLLLELFTKKYLTSLKFVALLKT
ncbi:hypothetical protein K1719_046280 [Acacia pycnantha]|nr:hypothetical protein K1719_046280 [Acacia pycnantha]